MLGQAECFMVKITFIQPQNSKRIDCDAALGESVLNVAQRNGIDMEGACEGSMACSTCHVIVAKDWFAKLPTASEEEDDMLDLTYGLKPTSRLGCQIIIDESLDGLVLHLPAETNNMLL